MDTTWIVVADGTQACSYQYQGPRQALRVVKGSHLEHVNEPSRNLVTSPPGRRQGSAEGLRSAMEPATDARRHEKEVFAREISSFLERRVDAFDHLIIAAPAKVLGDIRQIASERVLEKVTHELDKELTNIPAHELPQHLASVLNIDASTRPREPS